MENNQNKIDYTAVFHSIWIRKKLFAKTMGIAFVLAIIWIFPQPRYYSSQVSLAPETGNSLGGDAISSLATSFGFDIGNLQSNDAIYPTLYPEILKSTNFVVRMFNVHVTTDDKKLSTTYYDYLTNHTRQNPYTVPFAAAIKFISSIFSNNVTQQSNNNLVDPFRLTKKQDDAFKIITKNIDCKVDKKTDVITISVKDQDPYICACIADTVRARLQEYITDYRTKKARHDMLYYEKLTQKAKAEYERAIGVYSGYKDAHFNVILENSKSRSRKLERDVEIKYSTYSAINNQLQAAKAKVQERTPAFTIIQQASVPLKPDSPKRMIFVAICLFLTFCGTSIYVLRDIVK